METKRDTKDFRMGTCALGKGVLKERRFLHIGKPSQAGSGGALELQRGVQCSKTGAPKTNGENSPQRLSQTALPNWVAQVLSLAHSERGLAAKIQASGIRPQRGGQCRLPQRYSKGPGIAQQRQTRKLSICQRNKGSFLQEGSNATLWFHTLTERETLPSRCWKGVSCLWSAAPEIKR